MRCYCCSGQTYAQCCYPFIAGEAEPQLPEQLMRSRFSAYCIGDYSYVLNTYCKEKSATLSEAELSQSAQETKWFALNIVDTDLTAHTVSFKAFYFYQRKPHVLYETSRFIRQSQKWVYVDGDIHSLSGPVKIGRNDPCPCLRPKKFKQCCMSVSHIK